LVSLQEPLLPVLLPKHPVWREGRGEEDLWNKSLSLKDRLL
jgi:hypothetical protein